MITPKQASEIAKRFKANKQAMERIMRRLEQMRIEESKFMEAMYSDRPEQIKDINIQRIIDRRNSVLTK